MNGDSFDIADESANHDVQPASAADLLSTFDENIASAPTLLLNRSDGELNQSSTLKRGHRTSSRFRDSPCCGTSS